MRIDILTLFPDTVGDVLSESILGRAQERSFIKIEAHQIREYTDNKQNQVDDYPYGGGRGAIMQAEPLYRCWNAVRGMAEEPVHTIYMSPCGHTFTQADAIRLSKLPRLVLVCGHYEGIDQRFIDECVDEEISLGDFVLTGGEIAAMAVTDAVCRMVPGVLADPECFEDESHYNGLLEYPQYSRPAIWRGREVPEILLSGNHANVEKWRRKQSLLRTRERRPDMYEVLDLSSKQDQKLLKEMAKDERLSKATLRKAAPGDEEVLAYLQTESWKAAFGGILTEEELIRYTDLEKAKAMYTDVLAKQYGEGWILSVEGKPQAFAFWSSTREADMEGFAELICIHSLKATWRKGYGSLLFEKITSQMKAAGYRKMMLWVFEENTRARKFYQHFGLNSSEKRKPFGAATEIMYTGKV